MSIQKDSSVWDNIRSKPTMLLGMIVILVMTIMAVFAYTFIPDKSNDANNQISEIPLKPIGYTVRIFSEGLQNESSSFVDLINGRADNASYVAYDSVNIQESIIIFYTPIGYQKILQLKENYKGIGESYLLAHSTNKTYWLGTDKFGRDIFSRLVLGIRISLLAGFMAVLVSLFIGLFLGTVAGYYKGWVDQMIMFLINITWSIPTILLVFAIVLAFGRGLGVIFLAVGLTMWVDVARIVRGQVMSVKEEQFITAARSIGQNTVLIFFKHILPNIAGPVLVIVSANFATAILIEAGLSYLGFGINPPAPSLGNMLNENYGYALSGNITIALLPAFLIMILVLAFNLIGSGLRDMYDVKN